MTTYRATPNPNANTGIRSVSEATKAWYVYGLDGQLFGPLSWRDVLAQARYLSKINESGYTEVYAMVRGDLELVTVVIRGRRLNGGKSAANFVRTRT